MAGKIGIVLALDGEQKFAAGMRNASTSAKNCKDELKRMQTEMRGSANTAESLAKKHEALRRAQESYQRVLTAAKAGQRNAWKAYKEQGDALQKLSAQYEDAVKAVKAMEDAGKTSTDEYKKAKEQADALAKAVDQQAANYQEAGRRLTEWDQQVASAKEDVQNVNAELKKNDQYMEEASKSADGCAKSIDAMGDEAKDAAGDLDEGGKSLKDFLMYTAGNLAADALKAVGEKALEAAKYVIDVGSQFEASMSKVAGLSGATTSELAEMEAVAKQLGSTTRFSASEVADGFSYMALAGWNAQQSIDAIPGILDLAAASQMDLAEASDMVTDYLSAFGMEASEATKMADMMAYAQANSNTSTQQLGDAFGNCAANMHAAGQDMETTTAVLEAFANQGVKGSEAGTKLSAIMRDITAKMKDGAIQIGDTAVAVTDADGNFRDLTDILADVEAATDGMGNAEKAAALSTTFTSRSVGGLNMILTEGTDKIKGYKDQLGKADGAASSMAATMQDNLAGKVTEFNSAMEGLGIQLYGYFSGPLKSAVSMATSLISGITTAITPQKSELEKFLEDTQKSIDAVNEAIDAAEATVEAGEKKSAEIETVGQEIQNILTACEKFNLITLDDGRTQIQSANGKILGSFKEVGGKVTEVEGDISEFAKDGMSVEALLQSCISAKDGIGTLSTEADTVETRLDKFAERGLKTDGVSRGTHAIVQLFNEAGEEVETFETTVSDSGKVDLDTSKIKEGTDLAVTYFDGADQKVKTFKGSIESIGDGGLNVNNLSEGFTQVADSVQSTYTITDAYTKLKMDKYVELMGGSVKGLSDAWDSATGTLTANKEELEKWFDTAKQVAVAQALEKAIETEAQAVADATIARLDAQSGLNAALEQGRQILEASGVEVGNTIQSWEDLSEAYNNNRDAVDQYELSAEAQGDTMEQVIKSAAGQADAVDQATAAEERASEAMDARRQRLEGYQAVMESVTEGQDEAGESTENMGKSMDDAGEDVETLEDRLKRLGLSTEQVAEKMEKARQTAFQAIDDAVNDAIESAKNAFSINPFEAWEKNTENGMQTFADAMTAQIDAMNEYASNLQIVSQHVGQEITPEFLQYLQDMGEDGAQLLAEITKELGENGDPSKVEAIVQQYTEALDAQDKISKMMAMNALAYKLGIKEFGSSDKEWQDVRIGIERSVEGTDEALEKKLYGLVNTAQEMGVAIPEGFKEALDAGSEDPQAAIEAMIDILQQAIEGQQDGIIAAARKCGIEIPSELVRGLSSGGAEAEQAWQQIVQLITGAEIDTSGAEATGEALVDATAESMENSSGEATAAGDTVAAAATEAIGAAVGGFQSAGTLAGVSFATAITNYGDRINSAANARASAAAQAAGSHSGEFTNAGSSMGQAYANGVASVDTYTSGQTIANNAVSGATSVDTSGAYSVGSNIGSGINQGISDWIGTIVETARSAVRQAVAGAKQEADIHSPSRVFRDQVGKMIGAGLALGIEQSTGLVVNAAEGQMNRTLAALNKWIVANRSEIQKSGTSYAEAVSYGWQELAKQQLNNNFGISKTKTTGSGENETTVKKSPEEMSQEILRAAQQYLKNVQTLYDVSDAETEAYWTNVRKHLTEGTQAWFDATEQIKRAREAQAETRRKIEEEEAKEEEERRQAELEKLAKHDSELLARSQKYLEHKKIIADVSPDAEIKYWEKIQARMKQGSDEWYEVTKKLKDLRAEQAEDAQKALEAEQELQRKQEEYAAQHDSRLLERADKYLDRKKTLNNVSIQYEIDYWQKIRARMKEGSEEWYTVTKTLNSLQKQQADEQAQAYTKILTDAQNYIQRRKNLDHMTVQQEIQYWEKVISQLKKGTKEYRDALTNLYQLRKQVGTVGTAGNLLDTYQTYYDMSARAEMEYWQIVRKQYRKGTEDRLQADKQYLQARRSYYDQLKKMNADYLSERHDLITSKDEEIAELRKKQADEILKYEQTRDQAIAASQEKHAEERRKINEQLKKDIEDVRTKMKEDIAAANKTYTDAVQARQKELMGAFDLFDAFESRSASGQDLLFNLQSQVAGYQDWMKAMRQLQKRGILSDDLIGELQGKGVENSAAIHALLSLTDKELKAYNDAYLKKVELTETQAKRENVDLLRETREQVKGFREEAAQKIEQLREDAKAARQVTWANQRQETKDAWATFREDTRKLKEETKAEIQKVRDKFKEEFTSLRKNYTEERKKLTQSINSDVAGLAKEVRKIASDQVASLTSAFTSAIGRLAGAGNNVGKTAQQVKSAKKNASGTMNLRDVFAWMDELGIGSEMVVRQSDGARLNTSVRPGDAIIPAASTKNLWNWSKLDPSELITMLKAQQLTLSQYINEVMASVASLASLNARVLASDTGTPAGGSDAMTQMMGGMLALLQQYMPYVAEQKTISVDGRELAGATAGYMSEELAMRSRRVR